MEEDFLFAPPYKPLNSESIADDSRTPVSQSSGFTYISFNNSKDHLNKNETHLSNPITLSQPSSEKIIPEFKVRFPPQKTFTCQFNQVKGQLNLLFNQSLRSIISIDISLKGDSLIVLKEFNDSEIKRDYYKNYQLFENKTNLFSSEIIKGTDVNNGDFLTYDFKLQFPDVELLPSSCNQLNSKTDADFLVYTGTEAYIDIRYYLLLRIHFFSDTSALECIEYAVPLLFQGDDSSKNYMSNFVNVDYDRFLYQRKFKQFVYNKEESKMINIGTSKSYGLGQVFSSKKNSKTVELRITISIPQKINLQLGVDQLPIVIESPCPLQECQHFNVNGQNTGLGYFQIEQLIISIDNFTVYNVMSNQEDGSAVNPIYNFTDSSLYFDIADFNFVEKLGGYVWVTTLESLICKSTSFAELLGKPTMNTITLKNYFSNVNLLNIKILVTNGQDKNSQRHWFNFRRNIEIVSQVPANEVYQFYNSSFFRYNLETADFARNLYCNQYTDPNGGTIIYF